MTADGARLGTGYIEIQPDFSRFQEALGRRLTASLAPAFRKAGKSAGEDLARGVDEGGFARALAPLRRRLDRFSNDAGEAIAAKIGKGATRAKGDMFGLADAVREVERHSRVASKAGKALGGDMFGIAAAASEAGRGLKFSQSQASAWRHRADGAASTANRFGARLKNLGYELGSVARGIRTSSGGFSGFDGVIARVNRGFSFFRNIVRTLRFPAMVAGIGLLAQGLSALASAAVAVTSALGPLAGALIALPAGALAAAQAFGVLKLATAGVGSTIKAALSDQVQGGQQAIGVMRQQEDAAQRVEDSQRNLADVERQAKFAQEDLTKARQDARRTLQDMRLESERASDSENGAVLSLRQARQELAKTLRDPASTGLDVQFAEAAVAQAKDDLEQTRVDAKRARDDYDKAQRKGIEKMPEVVAAKRAEADANRSVTDAERELQRAIKDSAAAMEQQGGAATAFQQQMAQLPAAGRKFVRLLLSLKPRLDELRAAAASGFFPGAEKGLRSVLKRFGLVKGLVGETAKALGALAAKAGSKLGSAPWGKDLARIGKLNTRIITGMGDAGLNLADAFRHILVSAEPFVDWLSESVNDLTGWVKTEAAAGRESGKLAGFFDRAREAMERLGPIFKGVGGALLNIGEASRPLGNEILDSLGKAAEGWRRWTDSARGQNRLKQYFTETKPAIFEMGRLIRDAGKAFFELGKQDGIVTLLRLVRTELVPALRDGAGAVTGWASDFIRQFGALRKEGVPTFDAFVQVLAEHAGQAGWTIAKALVKGFLNASVLGKLAIAGWLFTRFGGLKAFGKMGAEAGARLGGSLVKRVRERLAAEFAAEGGIGAMLQTRWKNLGKWSSRAFIVGLAVGIATLAYWLGTKIGHSIPEGTRVAIKRWGINAGENFVNALIWAINKGIRAINDTLDSLNVLGKLGVDAPEIGEVGKVNFHSQSERREQKVQKLLREGFINGPGGTVIKPDEIAAPKTDKAEAKLHAFSKAAQGAGEQAHKGFKAQLDRLPGIAERASKGVFQQSVPRLAAMADQGGKKSDAFAGRVGRSFETLAGSAKDAMGNIEHNVGSALKGLNAGKGPRFNLKTLPKVVGKFFGFQEGGLVPAFTTGGLASVVPGNNSGDRHTLSLNGVPVAKVESKEGIFVGNRNLMGALQAANEKVPRFPGRRGFQEGGKVGLVQKLRRGGLVEPKIAGDQGALLSLGQSAIHSVFEGAKDFLARQKSKSGGGLAGLSVPTGPIVQMARQMVNRLWGAGEWTPFAALETREADWDPNAKNPTSGAAGLAQALPPSKYPPGAWPYRGLESAKLQLQWMMQYIRERYGSPSGAWAHEQSAGWYQRGGLLKAANPLNRLARGGIVKHLSRRLASGGMIDPSWDAGGEEIASSIAQLVHAYAERYDIDITAGYDPGGGHVSPGHNVTGTATDVVPRDGNWDGSFAKGLETLAKLGFEVGYDGSIPGTQNWPDHGRGNHAHIEWVGNGTSGDARQRLRDLLGGVGAATSPSAKAAKAAPEPIPKKVPFKVHGGSTDMGGGTNAPASGEVATAALSFGPLPTTLKAVRNELGERRSQLFQYQHALRAAKKNKEGRVVRALEINIAKLRDRIRKLRRQQFVLAVQNRIGKKGKLPKVEAAVDAAKLAYEQLSEKAEQIMALEPEEGPQAAEYIKGQETPVWQSVFGAVGSWRNAILGGEEGATTRLAKLQAQIEAIQALRTTHPKAWKKRRFEIPLLRTAMAQVRELFNPGPPPSGSLEENLTEVQGPGHSRDRGPLPTDATPGVFGGIVWDTQLQLRELGINLKRALESGTEDDSGALERQRQLTLQANQRTAVSEAAFKVFRDFEKTYPVRDLPPFGGVFHAGGTVPGPASQEYMARLRGEERIRTPEQEIELAKEIRGLGGEGGGVTLAIDQLIVHPDGTVTAMSNGQEIKGIVREVIRGESALRLR